jgi:hypothetical protein
MNHSHYHPNRPVRNEVYATQLNNQGAKFLECNDFQLAIACFSESLRFCRGFVQRERSTTISTTKTTVSDQQQQQPSRNERSHGSHACCPQARESINAIMASSILSNSIANEHVRSDRPKRFLYRHAIQLPVPSRATSSSTCSSISSTTTTTSSSAMEEGEEELPKVHFLLSLTVLFNLALAHQLMAEQELQDPSSSSSSSSSSKFYCHSLLEKAVRLYQLGHNMLSRPHEADHVPVIDEDDPMAFSHCEILVLAMTNNLAVAYQSMGNFEFSERAFQYLLSLLHLCVYYGIQEDYPTVLDCFVDNAAAHCVEKSKPPAASAA